MQFCKYTDLSTSTHTHSHTFFNPPVKWGVGNDREREKEKEGGKAIEVGPGFLITPSAHSEDIPIR